jgi:uncharacterized membrane protein YidH (DUF202 family)
MKTIILVGIGLASFFLGIWGWAQVIGSIQNIRKRPSLIISLLLWLAILFGGYLVVAKLLAGYLTALYVGYGISLVVILFQGKIR